MVFLFFPVLRRGSNLSGKNFSIVSFYSSPSCDGDQLASSIKSTFSVSILPRLATGIEIEQLWKFWMCFYSSPSCDGDPDCEGIYTESECFYSSPSCDGDPKIKNEKLNILVSILPRLATGIETEVNDFLWFEVSILPRLATGIEMALRLSEVDAFLFFPVLRRGSLQFLVLQFPVCFYSSPSCDGDPVITFFINFTKVSILPRLATGIFHTLRY